MEYSQENSQKPKKSKIDNIGDKAHVLTYEDRKKGAKKSATLKSMRAEILREITEAVRQAGIAKTMLKAIKDGDTDLMTCCEKAIKLTGGDFNSSEDSVSKVSVEAKVEDLTRNISFSDAKPKDE